MQDLPYGERSAKHILYHIFKQIVNWKKQDSTSKGPPSPVYGGAPAQAYEYEGESDASAVEAVPVPVQVQHVSLAPMKSTAGRNTLQVR
jgi:hypothetical protein